MDQRARAALPLTTIGLILFINNLGVGLSTPVMPFLIRDLASVALDRAAEIGGILAFCYALAQFLSSSVIGGIGDWIGRRPVLLVTLVALGLDYAVLALAPNLGWLFAGRILSGLLSATWATANSCVGDAVPDADRGRAFGVLGSYGAAGFVLGPVVGGLAGEWSNRAPFFVASALALLGALVVFVRFRETLPPSNRRRFSIARANPIGSFLSIARHRLLLGCLGIIFLVRLAGQAQFSVWPYYGALKFGWGPTEIGLTVALFGVLLVAVQFLMAGRAIDRFGANSVVVGSLLLGIVAYAMLAIAPSPAWAIAGVSMGACAGLTFPALQKLVAAHSGDNRHGEVQGAVSSAISLAAVVGPPLMASLFGSMSDKTGLFLPGAPFVLSAILVALALLVLRVTTQSARRKN